MDKQSNSCALPLFAACRFLSCALIGILLVLFAQRAAAQESGVTALTQAGSEQVTSLTAIETAQRHAQSEITRIEKQYTQDEKACSTQFFVNTCRDSAKERRRTALEPARQMQIETDTQMRRLRAAERDAALADRNRKKASEAAAMEQETQQKTQMKIEGNTRNQARMAEKNQELLQDGTSRPQPRAHRATGHPHVDLAEDAQKRTGNIAAYEKKIEDAQAHQRDLAVRKVEKDRARKIPAPAGAQSLEPASVAP